MHHDESLEVAIDHQSSKPDFTALSVRGKLHAVEIKRPKKQFGEADFDRFEKYVHALRNLFKENESIRNDFQHGWTILLVCDGIHLTNPTKEEAMNSFLAKNEVYQINWNDFLTKAQRANSAFLYARQEVQKTSSELELIDSVLPTSV